MGKGATGWLFDPGLDPFISSPKQGQGWGGVEVREKQAQGVGCSWLLVCQGRQGIPG